MKNTFKIFVSVLILLFIASCSTKKDAFLNRSYHAVATKYNVLYNGKIALQMGLQELNENYTDNFWERLPIEPLKVQVLGLPGMQKDSDNSPIEFERAEEKAVKAVQKHSMLIARQERNKQIDDAYLLLGKARYYSKRFVPALEAFNFVLLNYPNANLLDETKIWQAKTLVRLQNEEQAIENLNYLLKDKLITKNTKENAHTAIAMAYIKMDSLQQVVNHLNKASLTNYNTEQTARNLFILGQIYREKNKIDSSNIAFQKVIDFKKAPQKYKIYAHLEKAKNVTNKEEALAVTKTLNKLIKNRDNRPYLDVLYYQVGIIEKENDINKAITYFKKSIQHSKEINFQKELSYEAVGNLYFDKTEFLIAGAYYDSILQITKNENTKRIRRLKRQRNNLEEVIFYENVSKTTDSILSLVAMSKEEQTAFFTVYIEKLKEKEKQQQQQQINTGTGFYNPKTTNNEASNNKGKWYFYNIQTVGFGKQEFQRIWGNRPLEDNWRLSDKTSINITNKNTLATQNTIQIPESEKYNTNFYLDKIPTNKTKIDSIISNRNNAYFKLGILYKEQFKELDLAIKKLEKLRTFNPAENILLPAKYHLYKIYSSQNNTKASALKKDIITNYANSKYAQIIINPTKLIEEKDTNSSEEVYVAIFYEYKEENFESVIEKSIIAIQKYEGQAIVPKFELLKAHAIGKRDGLLAFKKALDFVAINYPNTEEGKKALEIVETIKTKI